MDSAAWNYRYHHCCLAGYHIFKKHSLKNIAWITGLSDFLCWYRQVNDNVRANNEIWLSGQIKAMNDLLENDVMSYLNLLVSEMMREGESLNWSSFLLIFVRFLTLLSTFAGLHWISLIFFRLDKSFPSFNRYTIWIFVQSQVDGQRVKDRPRELKKSRVTLIYQFNFLRISFEDFLVT